MADNPGMPSSPSFVNALGLRLETVQIQAAADTALPTLVFLHEGLGSVSMWRDWPAQLCAASGRQGLVYSRQGYGSSSPRHDARGPTRDAGGVPCGRLPPDYMHHEAWQVLPALLEQLGVRRPVLVGHSDGGSIALLHASRFTVAGCVVMAPHVMVEEVSVAAIAQARDAYLSGGPDSPLRQGLQRHHADVDGAFWQWNDVWLSDAFRGFDIRGDCRRIEAPLLCIQGEDDPYGSMRQIDEIAPAGRKQMLKLAGCGHAPHKDQAQAVTQAVARFVRELA